jgi:hypothetical protein
MAGGLSIRIVQPYLTYMAGFGPVIDVSVRSSMTGLSPAMTL